MRFLMNILRSWLHDDWHPLQMEWRPQFCSDLFWCVAATVQGNIVGFIFIQCWYTTIMFVVRRFWATGRRRSRLHSPLEIIQGWQRNSSSFDLLLTIWLLWVSLNQKMLSGLEIEKKRKWNMLKSLVFTTSPRLIFVLTKSIHTTMISYDISHL